MNSSVKRQSNRVRPPPQTPDANDGQSFEAIPLAAPEHLRNRDSDLHYLSGFSAPEAGRC